MAHIDPTPAPAPEGEGRSRIIKIAAIVVAMIVVISGIAFAVARGQGGGGVAATPAPVSVEPASTASASEPAPSEPTTQVPSTEPSVPATPMAPPPSDSSQPTATSRGCTTASGTILDPKRFKVDARGVDSKMLVVGKDSQGNPGAPPLSEGQTTAWYNGSSDIGSTKGNVILTIHTYSDNNGGNALGNKLYSDSKGLKVGDVIRITDASGKQVCYRYTGNKKVWVSSYDPASGVFHNQSGPPQLAIMICWDHNAKTNDWDSRVIFYASLIPAGQA